ncbi:acyl-CoA dehydrogenase family protein [Sphingobium cupriresistens]|uniref:Acyl-CoA dehydrogenase n=1 Tax=Sphingobium cupriresistens LL01 TaxID=1420583 RepID=A0A0J8AA47_9SPHN|nr:acyl-CoA dehydrogenase family protein [Sphingobium cupriresistens]KMS52085.1 acyl-CoA dehydrogenase [Sphingobium cupriresistens LL01]
MNAFNALHECDAAQQPAIATVSDELIASLRGRRREFADLGQLPADVVQTLRELGVYRALVSARYGGVETSPATFLRLVERLSEADGSVGWVASFGVSSMYLASLPEETLAKVYAGGPDVIFAGALFPPQPAARVKGGLQVSGRWKFGSGSTGADIIGVGIKVDGDQGGLPRMAVMPASSVTIERNWDVIGLQGTGSHDLVVDGVVVPDEWTFIRGGKPSLDTPLYRYPSMAFAAQVLAIVGVGVARAALDEITRMAGGRASITGAPTLADRAYVQSEIAKAEAKLRSARAFFYEATDDVWATLCAGGAASVKQAALLRLASSHVARIGCEVAQTAFMLSGTTGIYNDQPIATYVHDAMVVAQHAFLSEGTWQSAGRVLLGLDTPPGFP